MIPYGRQTIGKDDIASVVKVLNSDFITQGPKIREFEDSLCAYTGARYAICVSSGTAALHIACLAAGIQKQDEVITSPITFVASANCVLYCGGTPVFADVEADTGNIDTHLIERRITKKTRAVIPVHFAGHPCDLREIHAIAKRHGLLVIEDAAHALGASYRGARVGSGKYSDMTIFSFHPVKSITTGEGGAVLTNSRNIYNKLLMFRTHGITKQGLSRRNEGEWYYEMQALGYNYRITDIQAALGVSQLAKLDGFIARRRKIASLYDAAFARSAFFDIPVERTDARSSYHLYPIRIKPRFKGRRTEVFSRLRANGLGVQVHYIPVHLQPYYRGLGYRAGSCPAAEDFYRGEISLPIYPRMGKAETEQVITTVKEILR